MMALHNAEGTSGPLGLPPHCTMTVIHNSYAYRVVQKTDPLVYFDDNFGKYGPI